MFEELFDRVARKTVKKSGKAVKEEIKKTVDEATTGKNGQKLLVGALIMSGIAMIFSLCKGGKPVVVNIYNGGQYARA